MQFLNIPKGLLYVKLIPAISPPETFVTPPTFIALKNLINNGMYCKSNVGWIQQSSRWQVVIQQSHIHVQTIMRKIIVM